MSHSVRARAPERPRRRSGFARRREFWRALALAALLGLVTGVIGLAFLTFVTKVPKHIWGDTDGTAVFSGQVWWVPLGLGFGLVVGLMRRALTMKPGLPNIFDEIGKADVDYRETPQTVLVSAVSLVGGVSLGPEAALGGAGGALGAWASDRRGDDQPTRATNVLTGISGAFGGLFTAPLLGPVLITEIAKPEPDQGRSATRLIALVLAATLSFCVFYPIVGHTFMAIYHLPAYTLKLWHLLAAVGIGVMGAVLAVLTGVAMKVARTLAERAAAHPVALCTLGGAIVGFAGWFLPLTLFSGSDELETVIAQNAAMGFALVAGVVVAKMLTFAISAATGFIGGVVFPMLFIGGTAGTALHLAIPGLPMALAVSCGMAAVPGAIAGIPFSLILIVAFAAAISPSDVAPIAVAVLTSYLLVSGMGLVPEEKG